MEPNEGLYDELLDAGLHDVLSRYPELRSVFGKLDPEEEPARLAAFVGRVLEKALQAETDSVTRFKLCNELIASISAEPAREHLSNKKLIDQSKRLLLEITPRNYQKSGVPRPQTSVVESSLFTGSPSDPQLVHELVREMRSANRCDFLVSFIKWSGLQLLLSAFEELTARGGELRIITTSYMGASDPEAIEALARLANTSIRVSYDVDRTRLHAKAYHFSRNTGFSTAYIGSANMSRVAITSGLEWTLKVTAQDMPHILEKFVAEFETYWHSRDFVPFDSENPQVLRDAIRIGRNRRSDLSPVFFDVKPHPFQERILDALNAERYAHNVWRNLVVAATGTGKTVVAAFDFKRYFEQKNRQAKLLFVAHRKEILEQAIGTFRGVLRIPEFGELLADNYEPTRRDHLFCSVGMLSSRKLAQQVGADFYDFVVVDEVHHGPSASYRSIFNSFTPEILLGLTATPERMDGQSVARDFHDRFAAEIRLPEALEEKLLCPFHYFGVADPISLNEDKFWSNGKYNAAALENVYTGDDVEALRRVDLIADSLHRYEPDIKRIRGIGFCVSVKHAVYMAEKFNDRGIKSAALVGTTESAERPVLLDKLRDGRITILFTRDVLNEGLDVPNINTVLFLRPTDSMTVFLQQLGRGLRHAPEKDNLTVLDFVGQAHRRYRVDLKFKALLSKHRYSIEKEVDLDFPHLPAGCSIQLDRISKEHVLKNIRANLKNLKAQVVDRLETFEAESGLPVTFGNFVNFHDYEPGPVLDAGTWSEWKGRARLAEIPDDPDLSVLKAGLVKSVQMDGPKELALIKNVIAALAIGEQKEALRIAGDAALRIHYRLWGKSGKDLGIESLRHSFARLSENPSILRDLCEAIEWAEDESRLAGTLPELPFECPFELHAHYSNNDLKAGLGKATMATAGERGVGVLHFADIKAYALLITFQKSDHEFSPSTMYADYPISRELLHWESQANTPEKSATGQNLIHQASRGYTILIFARDVKKMEGRSLPFCYLGPATVLSHKSERPIQMIWQLEHAMPALMYDENRRGA